MGYVSLKVGDMTIALPCHHYIKIADSVHINNVNSETIHSSNHQHYIEPSSNVHQRHYHIHGT